MTVSVPMPALPGETVPPEATVRPVPAPLPNAPWPASVAPLCTVTAPPSAALALPLPAPISSVPLLIDVVPV